MPVCFHEPSLHVDLRNSTRYTNLFISRCGRFVRDTNHPNFLKMLNRNKSERYLYLISNYKKVYIHRLVALGWVFNPAPRVFTCIDHMDGDTQNNDATNLRFVTHALNSLNRKKIKGFEKRRRKNGSVVYRSRVCVGGVRFDQYASTEGEAIELTKQMQSDKFDELYNATLTCTGTTPGETACRRERLAHHFLWTDDREGFPESGVETPEGVGDTNPRVRECNAGRYPQFIVHDILK